MEPKDYYLKRVEKKGGHTGTVVGLIQNGGSLLVRWDNNYSGHRGSYVGTWVLGKEPTDGYNGYWFEYAKDLTLLEELQPFYQIY